jgi:hypothetical protein
MNSIGIVLLNCVRNANDFADFMRYVHSAMGDFYISEVLEELFHMGYLDFESYYLDKKACASRHFGECRTGTCTCSRR